MRAALDHCLEGRELRTRARGPIAAQLSAQGAHRLMHPRIALGVNIDHVATLRQQRHTRYPEPVQAALLAEQAGADNITLHLREDRRHIQERDVQLLAGLLSTRMNLEMAATPAMIEFACAMRPADCCLVPERRAELTTEGGLDVVGGGAGAARALRPAGAAGHPRGAVHRCRSRADRGRRGARARRSSSCIPALYADSQRRARRRASWSGCARRRGWRPAVASRCMPVTG